MSNHFSVGELKFPGDDRRLDLTDVFMLTSADDADKTVLIMDSNSAVTESKYAQDQPNGSRHRFLRGGAESDQGRAVMANDCRSVVERGRDTAAVSRNLQRPGPVRKAHDGCR